MTDKFLEVIHCDSVREFLHELDPNNDRWGDSLARPWVYRGQTDASWKLIPSAWRRDSGDPLQAFKELTSPLARRKIDAVLNARGETDQTKIDGLEDIIKTTLAELEAVRKFTEFSDESGLHLRGGPTEILMPEDYPSSATKISLQHVSYNFPNENTALCQHHGLPTRLLDWTRDPRVAAYFACIGNYLEPEPPQTMAVWALDRTNCPPELKTFDVPRAGFDFLHAQDGLFTWFPSAENVVIGGDPWPDVESVLRSAGVTKRCLWKITAPGSLSKNLAAHLFKERIFESKLMPNYEHVAKDVLRTVEWFGRDGSLPS